MIIGAFSFSFDEFLLQSVIESELSSPPPKYQKQCLHVLHTIGKCQTFRKHLNLLQSLIFNGYMLILHAISHTSQQLVRMFIEYDSI